MGSRIFQRNQRTAADDRSANKFVYAAGDADFISAQGRSACGGKADIAI
jgi:hypothetical protein